MAATIWWYIVLFHCWRGDFSFYHSLFCMHTWIAQGITLIWNIVSLCLQLGFRTKNSYQFPCLWLIQSWIETVFFSIKIHFQFVNYSISRVHDNVRYNNWFILLWFGGSTYTYWVQTNNINNNNHQPLYLYKLGDFLIIIIHIFSFY